VHLRQWTLFLRRIFRCTFQILRFYFCNDAGGFCATLSVKRENWVDIGGQFSSEFEDVRQDQIDRDPITFTRIVFL
jgi:hypothetical protein